MALGNLVSDATRQLRDWLAAGQFKAGDRLPSERALARELGLKYYALNRAMSRLIAEGSVERQGYRLSLTKEPQISKRLTVHLIVARRSHHLASYRRTAVNLNVDLVIHTYQATEDVVVILRQLDAKDTDGVLCDPPDDQDHKEWVRVALQLIRHGIPVVCSSGSGAADDISSIEGNVTHGVTLAFSHLTAYAHQEIALATFPVAQELGLGAVDYWKRLCDRNGLSASSERITFQSSGLTTPEDVEALVDLLTIGAWQGVTGIAILVGHSCALQSFFTKLAKRGRSVPESLSVVVIGNARTLHTVQPRVTAAMVDISLWHEVSFDLLLREVRAQRELGAPRQSACVRVLPRLMVRDSTRSLAPEASLPLTGEPGVEPSRSSAAGDKTGNLIDVKTADWERRAKSPYSLAAKAALSEYPRFRSIDLRPYANRPLLFRRGWLGDLPLRCLPAGNQEIHGVPFEILGGPSRSDQGAVIFRSTTNATGNAQKLPDRLMIPVSSAAEVVYVLHGCGYAKSMHAFASYIFHTAAGIAGTVPMVSLGKHRLGHEAGPGDGQGQANIQDWWSDYPHQDFPHARMAPLLESDEVGHVNRHVFLYTLEWINPTPEQPLTHIEIQVDPAVPTTLGVLAITVVKPRGRA